MEFADESHESSADLAEAETADLEEEAAPGVEFAHEVR
jgi:hypothetical protein